MTGDRIPDLITAAGAGAEPQVQVISGADGTVVRSWLAYAPDMTAGVRVAVLPAAAGSPAGVVTVPGEGGAAHVRVFDPLTGGPVREFFADDLAARGGGTVAAADLTADGVPDIVAGGGVGRDPTVTVYDGASGEVAWRFAAYDPGFRGGVNVAAGELTGDGVADVVTGAGAGGAPHVRVFDGATRAGAGSFLAYDGGLRAGVNVSTGTVGGLGYVLAGAGPGGGPHVRGLTAAGAELFGLMAYDPGYRGGVAVAGADLDGDGASELITAPGAAGSTHVRMFRGRGLDPFASFFADPYSGTGGFAVAPPVNPSAGDGDRTAPVLVLATPPTAANANPVIAGRATDAGSGVAGVMAAVDGVPLEVVAVGPGGSFTFTPALPLDGSADGLHTVTLRAADRAGNVAESTTSFTLDTRPPVVTLVAPVAGTSSDRNVTVAGRVADSLTGVVWLRARLDGGTFFDVAVDPAGGFAFDTALPLDGTADGEHTVTLRAADRAGNAAEAAVRFTLDAAFGPPVDATVATTVAAATRFLYTGPNPVQTGVAPGTIEDHRAAVLRGRVTAADGSPLPSVVVTVLGRPEFGRTVTRDDGMFDLAVNGGGVLTVDYSKDGMLPAQRQADAPWNGYVLLPDVVLIPLDERVTAIDLAADAPVQVARGSPVADADGARQNTLLFARGTHASMVLPDGTTRPLETLHVRATEYTVGPAGPRAMPGELPPSSGYTYAVELSVDEAVAAGATEVRFDQPVVNYVENFLGFPVGGIVPAGYYDRARGLWVASDNGRVIQILSEAGGLADLDLDGDGAADGAAAMAALGVTDVERQQLADLYDPGQSLWRVPLTHFTPWDYNWPFGPPEDAVSPNPDRPRADDPLADPDLECGSVIEVQNLALGESVAVAGTPFALRYDSGRLPGRTAADTMTIPVTGAALPASLKRAELTVEVAGRRFVQSFAPVPNQAASFTWDGRDAYGRTPRGAQAVTVTIGFVYDGVYQQTSRFGYNGNGLIDGSRARQEVTLLRKWQGSVGGWDARAAGLGGWVLDVHHAYDPFGRTLYLGDGSERPADAVGSVITTVAGSGHFGDGGDGGPATQAQLRPEALAVGPDGSVYVADAPFNNRIRRIAPDGVITTVAGGGAAFADGVPASQTALNQPRGIAVGPDGSLYIADTQHDRVRRVGPDGIITTVAGGGIDRRDGVPATAALVERPAEVAVGPDGSLYIVEYFGFRVRRVDPEGRITTVVNVSGGRGFAGDGGPAKDALLDDPNDIAVGPDGSVYIADTSNMRVRRVGPDGTITTVAGTGPANAPDGDGGPATAAQLRFPLAIAVGPDGSLYIDDNFGSMVRRVGPDGIITTVAGTAVWGTALGGQPGPGDGGPALRGQFYQAFGVSVGPDGSLYVADSGNSRVRRIAPALSGLDAGGTLIPSEDGSEAYAFDPSGRHLRTVDALTGLPRYTFAYDAAGRLASVTDPDGNLTRVERDAAGNPAALVAPFGQRTELATDAGGYLEAVTNPAGETTWLGYAAGGLLTSLTEPGGQTHRYGYDTLGRLAQDADPAGGFTRLDRTEQGDGFTVTLTTAEGRVSTYAVENRPNGDERRVNTSPAGLVTTLLIGADGTRTLTDPDGTVTRRETGPDPRWGMAAPVTKSLTVTTPAGLQTVVTEARTVTLANPADPLGLVALTSTVTINGDVYRTTFNAAARTLTTTTPVGRASVTTLDDRGRVVRFQAPGVEPVQYTYDARGLLTSAAQGGRTATLTYDPLGQLQTLTDPLGRTATFAYDAAGRIVGQTFPDGREVRIGYDADGNTTAVTPPGRDAHAFTYTAAGRLAGYTPPAAGSAADPTRYAYNRDGQLDLVVDADGDLVDLDYCGCGRLVEFTDARGATTLAYDPVTGNLDRLATPGGETLTYGYDGGLLTDTTWTGTVAGTVARAYDADYRVSSESVNGGAAVTFGYDRDGLLTRAGDLVLARGAATGRLDGTTLGSVRDFLGYNPFGEVQNYRASFGSQTLYSVEHTPDDLGRIARRVETVGGVTRTFDYGYDAAGRLEEVRQDGVVVARYGYDANGNRLTRTDAAGATEAGVYDAQDRLVSYGGTTYAYTDAGELQSKTQDATGATTTYEYDPLGNLVGVTLPDGTQVGYVVDGEGRRVGKKVGGTLVQGLLYGDDLRPVAELDGAGTVVSRFVYATGVNVPEYMARGGVTYRIITDHLGSPHLVVNAATGEVAQRVEYDEFGRVLLDTNPGFQLFGFAGGLYDRDTGLVHFGAREYDPQTGRWTAKDPIGFAGGDTNLYGYVSNDPVNLRDPSGLFSCGPSFEEQQKPKGRELPDFDKQQEQQRKKEQERKPQPQPKIPDVIKERVERYTPLGAQAPDGGTPAQSKKPAPKTPDSWKQPRPDGGTWQSPNY